MFTRKSVSIALTVIALLAILVPMVSAAPEWVHGINITSPTAAAPAYVNPAKPVVDRNDDGVINWQDDGPDDGGFTVKYDLEIVGTQVDDVWLRIRAIDVNNSAVVWEWQHVWPGTALVTGVNSLTSDLVWPYWDPGWYRVEACVMDGDWFRPLFCDVENNAVLIDTDNPGARLLKPVDGAWVTGTQYLMVGKAWDPEFAWVENLNAWVPTENDPLLRYGGIKDTWFEYCVISNWQGDWCGPTDASWVRLGAGAPSGVVDQWNYVWDSTQVPDDLGVVRFCARDFVNRRACDYAVIQVENRKTLWLHAGWNLISSPLLLYDADVADVLLHLKDAAGNPTWDAIYAMTNEDAGEPDVYTWSMYNSAGVGSLAQIVAGKGYWIHMKTDDDLTLVGTWLQTGPIVPQEYEVFEGWNLIGYTHWGQPTDAGYLRTAMEYLGGQVAGNMEQLWAYDAWSEQYFPVADGQWLVEGRGYWLALSDGGTINP